LLYPLKAQVYIRCTCDDSKMKEKTLFVPFIPFILRDAMLTCKAQVYIRCTCDGSKMKEKTRFVPFIPFILRDAMLTCIDMVMLTRTWDGGGIQLLTWGSKLNSSILSKGSNPF